MSSQLDCDTATGQELAGAVADYIEEHGWTQGTLRNEQGEVCLIGGIAGACVGDPSRGYILLNGMTNLIESEPPKAVIELAGALGPVLPYEAIQHRGGITCVLTNPLTYFNDMVVSDKDELIGVLRKIQQGRSFSVQSNS